MLKVNRITPALNVEVEFDPYVPLQIKTRGEKSSTPLRWSYLASDESLLDLAVNDETGELQEITLVAIASTRLFPAESLSLPRSLPEGEGLIACDTWQWASNGSRDGSNYIRENENLSLFIGRESVVLIIGENQNPAERIRSGRVSIFLDPDRSISAVEVQDISQEEFETLKLAVGRT